MAALLDTTIVNVAVATLGHELHATVTTTQWAITGYLLAIAIVIPRSGWAVDRFGARRVWLFSLAAAASGSVLCGTGLVSQRSDRLPRALGRRWGLLLPVGQTVLARTAGPRRRTRAMALIGRSIQLAL